VHLCPQFETGSSTTAQTSSYATGKLKKNRFAVQYLFRCIAFMNLAPTSSFWFLQQNLETHLFC